VSFDPLLVDRVEVLRGPGALLYGSSAVGGVVNLVNRRVPGRANDSFVGRLSSSYSSVDQGRNLGAVVENGGSPWALHFDASARGTGDYAAPIPAKRVGNSSVETLEGALGASRVRADGSFFGVGLSGFGSEYGSVAEPEVRIDMKRQRADLAGELKGFGPFSSGRYSGAFTHYKHQEMEGEEVGTTFRNRGTENRVDLRLGSAIVGVQQQWFLFEAIGEEAFLPSTHNHSVAAFGYQEWKLGSWTPSLGLRAERAGSRTDAESHWFTAPSVALGALYELTPGWAAGVSATYTERAPNYQELYAGGAHVATGVFEQGDTSLGKERSRTIEASLRRKEGAAGEGRVSVFVQDFPRFIALSPTGTDDVGSGFPIQAYRPVEAVLYGVELECRAEHRLSGAAVEAGTRLDLLRGRNLSNDTDLPRITPARATIDVAYRTGSFRAETELQLTSSQTFVAPNETPTGGFGIVNLGAEVPLSLDTLQLRLTGRLNNVFDRLGFNHVSFVKDASPLPGRSFVLGVQAML
jgi:iron complex outermembrane receptor protein